MNILHVEDQSANFKSTRKIQNEEDYLNNSVRVDKWEVLDAIKKSRLSAGAYLQSLQSISGVLEHLLHDDS